MMVFSNRVVRFGGFEVDLAAGQLRRDGVLVKLPDQAFQTLAMLLETPGEVVSRESLRGRLWPDGVFVDFDNNLNSAVARLREALGDSANQPQLIETLPRRGYRFIQPLAEKPAARQRMLVLPFVNISGDPDLEPLADGMTDDLIGALVGVSPDRLAVIARTTAMAFKGRQQSVAEIGREIGVDYVVEGSVRCSGRRVIVNVQLIQASDETHLWADRYDAELNELIGVEATAAQSIAARLGFPSQKTPRKPTGDVEAYRFFTQGRFQMYQWTLEAVTRARQCFEEAIARDPNFAAPYEALAELAWSLGFFGFAPPRESCAAGIFCALRALEIDPTLGETHAVLAMFRKELDYDWAEVDREMNLALALSPGSPVIRVRNAVSALMPHGRIAEAIAEIERALELDPFSPMARTWYVVMLTLSREYGRALEQGDLLVSTDPRFYLGHVVRGIALTAMKEYDEAALAQEKGVEVSAQSPFAIGWLGLALSLGRRIPEARALLAQLEAAATVAYVPPSSFAWIYLGLGDVDLFFEWMDRAIDARDPMVIPLRTYPFFDPLRSDPRYTALLRRMGLE